MLNMLNSKIQLIFSTPTVTTSATCISGQLHRKFLQFLVTATRNCTENNSLSTLTDNKNLSTCSSFLIVWLAMFGKAKGSIIEILQPPTHKLIRKSEIRSSINLHFYISLNSRPEMLIWSLQFHDSTKPKICGKCPSLSYRYVFMYVSGIKYTD